MNVSIIIPTFNRRTYLEGLIIQLLQEKDNTSNNVNIIVVNDGSTDDTADYLKTIDGKVLIVDGPGDWWFTRSVNEGLRKALQMNCDWYLVLNDDVIIPFGFLDRMIDDASEFCQNGLMAPMAITQSKPHRIMFSGAVSRKKVTGSLVSYLPYLSAFDENVQKGVYPSLILPGRGLLISKNAISKLGLLNQRLPQYGSDSEYSFRAIKVGLPVVVNWNVQIKGYENLTDESTINNRPSLAKFVTSLFNDKSRNYIFNESIIAIGVGEFHRAPLVFLLSAVSKIKNYIK